MEQQLILIKLLLLNKYLKIGKLLTLLVCLFLFKNIIYSQTNLIQNSSFEKYTLPIDCNGGAFDIAGSPSFHHVVDNWYTQNSPDYFISTCVTSWYNIPLAFFGESYAKHGNAFSGIGVFDVRFNYQEYIYQNLSSALKPDTTYCLSFFVSRADRFPFAIKNIGAYFSNNIPIISSGYINATPQIINTSSFLTDTINWIEIQGCFTAQGGEQYITIGNYNSNANTDTMRIQSTNPLTGTGTDVSYYYVDSVSLWQNNFPTAINEIGNGGGFNVYPNPASSVISIKIVESIVGVEAYRIKITDVLGREVLVCEFKEQLNISQLEKGIYFLSLYKNYTLIGIKKIIKE